MKTTDKQIAANRRNAGKSTGPVTPSGTAIAARNALKHGLLAKEIVIDAGEGAESQEQFDAVLLDLKNQFDPQGPLEEMLVEKIVVAYWRLRRAHKYEVGLIRQQLDNAADVYYGAMDYPGGHKIHRTDEQIDAQIRESQECLDEWQSDRDQFLQMRKSGKDLKETYDFEGNWEALYNRVSDIIDESCDGEPASVRASLNKAGWTDDQIWQAHIDLCDETIAFYKRTIQTCRKEKAHNELALQVHKQLCAIPPTRELDRLLKYEGSIEKQFYKAMNQLERLQRLRAGDNVPAPVNMDVRVETEGKD